MGNEYLAKVAHVVLEADIKAVTPAVKAALNVGLSREAILNQGILRGLDLLGQGFQDNIYYVGDMIASAGAAKKAISILNAVRPPVTSGKGCRVIIGTVEGDIHDIGKNLVISMFRSYRFSVIDLGVDVSGDVFLEALRHYPDTKFVGLSALISTTLPAMKDCVQTIRKAYPNPNFRIMVGGAPVTEEFAREIGADIYTSNAIEAVQTAVRLLEDMTPDESVPR